MFEYIYSFQFSMDSYWAFREKLDQEHDWPTIYMFKFVVPAIRASEVKIAFANETLQTKTSKAGNYISFTMNKMINSSEEVVEIYKKAKKIQGLIAL